MNKTEEIYEALSAKYPEAKCELDYGTPFELLVSVILSAQCTDKRVNEVTSELFKTANTPEQFAQMEQSELERMIYPCGFYHNKAKNIIAASKDICDKFGGEVPRSMDELLSLCGVGRKTANVVLAVAFDEPTMPVDTHVFRVSHRLGLTDGKTPDETERDLVKLIETSKLNEMHHLFIFHGRYCCKSQHPHCEECPLTHLCEEYSHQNRQREKICL